MLRLMEYSIIDGASDFYKWNVREYYYVLVMWAHNNYGALLWEVVIFTFLHIRSCKNKNESDM